MQSIISHAGTIHATDMTGKYRGRVATLCGMNLKTEDSLVEQEPTCGPCHSALKYGEQLVKYVKQMGDEAKRPTVSGLAEKLGITEKEARDAVLGTAGVYWQPGTKDTFFMAAKTR